MNRRSFVKKISLIPFIAGSFFHNTSEAITAKPVMPKTKKKLSSLKNYAVSRNKSGDSGRKKNSLLTCDEITNQFLRMFMEKL